LVCKSKLQLLPRRVRPCQLLLHVRSWAAYSCVFLATADVIHESTLKVAAHFRSTASHYRLHETHFALSDTHAFL
jgi:hypothetical protein